ncbi:hypothetical protein RSO01_25130 [Reyranella soli]|uniref:Uncharacterized protein n=1 Tax=Reyranella soli TaxID=1230389 RepID=A0A512N8Q1_9HYPH|nr:hypothetical protein RSO01_25130 [Reyranella soli]
MTFAEKPKPVAYCAGCNMPASIEVVGTSCRNGDCNGTYKGAGAADEWMRCAACDGTGKVGTAFCETCHGSGWTPVRP